jgi:hypothetical protein
MAGLEGTVHLPAFGTVKKKTAAITAGLAVGGVLLVWYIRQRKAAQSASTATTATSSTAGDVTDPAGNVCSSADIDPQTGFCSGTAADLAALQQAGGGVGIDGGSGGSTTGTGTGTTTAFADNAAWAQAAEQYLGSDGADATAAAISKYIAGQQITAAQETVAEEAIAAEGYPPVAGANGYPPAMDVTGTPTGTGTPPGSTGAVTVPNVVGMRTADQAVPTIQAAGLAADYTEPGSGFSTSHIDYVFSQTPGAGTQVAKGSTVRLGSSSTKPN